MSKQELENIAEKANFIVNGYSFTRREDGFIGILNLEHPDCAMVIDDNCEIIETNMDEIEQSIVLKIANKNMQFMEVDNA